MIWRSNAVIDSIPLNREQLSSNHTTNPLNRSNLMFQNTPRTTWPALYSQSDVLNLMKL